MFHLDDQNLNYHLRQPFFQKQKQVFLQTWLAHQEQYNLEVDGIHCLSFTKKPFWSARLNAFYGFVNYIRKPRHNPWLPRQNIQYSQPVPYLSGIQNKELKTELD